MSCISYAKSMLRMCIEDVLRMMRISVCCRKLIWAKIAVLREVPSKLKAKDPHDFGLIKIVEPMTITAKSLTRTVFFETREYDICF